MNPRPRASSSSPTPPVARREFLHSAARGVATIAAASTALPACSALRSSPGRGRLRQSVAGWCFMNDGPRWDVDTLAREAAALGCDALELVDVKDWPALRRHGLVCAATKSHTFVRGMNNPAHWPECHAALTTAIEATAAAGFPNVMTFTGFTDTSGEPNGSAIDPADGIDHCVRGYRKIVGLAERNDVTLVLEPLNTRDPRPMRGHPGYLGDHVDECVEIVRRVGSPSLRLLFDVYHVQVMDGDLIRRIHELGELIAHVQVAGCPGRGPLTPDQEIHYPAVMRALADVGYDGYVGHEWLATGDARRQLAASVRACTV